ncbi:MAG TPA: hypothetical protein VMG10_37165 [Gemmataceae bacterium]|nr:hypothetical protein [Gemmataceae bacterium]
MFLFVVSVPVLAGEEKKKDAIKEDLPAPRLPPLTLPMAVVPKSVLRISLLDDERVRSELKLEKNQLAKIAKIGRDIRAKHKDELEKAGFGEGAIPPPITERKSYEIKERIDAEEEEASVKALPGILTSDQMKRLRQISLQAWQASGVNIFISPEVAKTLKLTKEKRQQIIVIEKQMKAVVEKSMHQLPTGESYIEQGTILKIVEAARSKVMANVLTDEQKKIWKEMLGKPCDSKWWSGEEP